MTEVPKIVHQRLRAAGHAAAEAAHPEADVLTAFAEQKLAQAEREGVLQHLALCGDCREVVALGLPAVESSAAIMPEAVPARVPVSVSILDRRNWFDWANLRWAALAAGVAIAVLVVRPAFDQWGKPNPTVSSVAKQPAETAAQPSSSASLAESVRDRELDAKASPAPEPGRQLALSKEDKRRASNAFQVSPPERGIVVADNLKPGSGRLDTAKDAPAKGVHAAGARALDKATQMNETVEVTGGATGAASDAAVGELVAKAEAPAIVKSKPARDEATVDQEKKKMAAAPAPAQATSAFRYEAEARSAAPAAMMKAANVAKQAPRWMISAGLLQRSLDDGQSWQTALKADHPLLCSANRGPDVWAAGQAGMVQHSSDGGATWNTVQVSSQGRALTSDVTNLEIREKEIVLATVDHETWSSTDGGKTWQKK